VCSCSSSLAGELSAVIWLRHSSRRPEPESLEDSSASESEARTVVNDSGRIKRPVDIRWAADVRCPPDETRLGRILRAQRNWVAVKLYVALRFPSLDDRAHYVRPYQPISRCKRPNAPCKQASGCIRPTRMSHASAQRPSQISDQTTHAHKGAASRIETKGFAFREVGEINPELPVRCVQPRSGR
jgi:hypothetical protein